MLANTVRAKVAAIVLTFFMSGAMLLGAVGPATMPGTAPAITRAA